MKIADYMILGLIILWIILALVYMIHRKRQGKCIGCSGCDGCTKSNCTKKQNDFEDKMK